MQLFRNCSIFSSSFSFSISIFVFAQITKTDTLNENNSIECANENLITSQPQTKLQSSLEYEDTFLNISEYGHASSVEHIDAFEHAILDTSEFDSQQQEPVMADSVIDLYCLQSDFPISSLSLDEVMYDVAHTNLTYVETKKSGRRLKKKLSKSSA